MTWQRSLSYLLQDIVTFNQIVLHKPSNCLHDNQDFQPRKSSMVTLNWIIFQCEAVNAIAVDLASLTVFTSERRSLRGFPKLPQIVRPAEVAFYFRRASN